MKQSNVTPQQVQRFMRGMGKTADEVADFMRRHGVKGRRIDCWGCPVTRAAYWFLGAEVLVGITSFALSGDSQSHKTPAAIGAFVTAFDHNKYPDLVL